MHHNEKESLLTAARESLHSNEDPAQSKINKYFLKKYLLISKLTFILMKEKNQLCKILSLGPLPSFPSHSPRGINKKTTM